MQEVFILAENQTEAGETAVIDFGRVIDSASVIFSRTSSAIRVSVHGSLDGQSWYSIMPSGTNSITASSKITALHYRFLKATINGVTASLPLSLTVAAPKPANSSADFVGGSFVFEKADLAAGQTEE